MARAQTFTNNQPASLVVGQADFTSKNTTASQTISPGPSAAAVSSTGKLAVSDANANRVLIYNAVPTTNGAPANVVVGQPNFSSTTAGTSASQIGQCYGTAFSPDGTKLLVSDFGNNRVLIFNTIPTTNGASADVVLGQPNFTSNVAPSTPTASSIAGVFGITFSGSRLLVATSNAARLLAFDGNTPPPITTNTGLRVPQNAGATTITNAQLKASDAELNPITFTLTGVPAQGVLKLSGATLAVGGTFTQANINAGNLTFTPSANAPIGSDGFKFTASDGQGGTVPQTTFAISVIEANSLVVTTNSDSSTDTDGLPSLREAAAFARTLSGSPTITFAANVTGTITLGGTNIDLSRSTGTISIQGPGAGVLTLNGNAKSNIFGDSAGTANITGLTFSNGDSSNAAPGNVGGAGEGGAIDSDGMALNLSDCVFTGNHSTDFGGAIDGDGVVTLARCTFLNNVSELEAILKDSLERWMSS